MKLPEDLEEKLDTIRWRIDIGNEATRLACYEAIVRDCTNAFIRLLGDSPQAKRAAIAVLHRYDLVAEQKTVAPQVSGNETGMPNGSTYPVPTSAAAHTEAKHVEPVTSSEPVCSRCGFKSCGVYSTYCIKCGDENVWTKSKIDTMVDRFLCWRLPQTFRPDGGISFAKTYNTFIDGKFVKDAPRSLQDWPVGTNLLTADEARDMFEYCLAEPNAAASQALRNTTEKTETSSTTPASAAAPCIAGQFASGLKTWATKP